MPIQISSVVAAHNSLWVGTENGLLLTFPFNAPTVVAEEAGWEVIKVSYMLFQQTNTYMYWDIVDLFKLGQKDAYK